MRVALGLKAHSGWAALAALVALRTDPRGAREPGGRA